VPDHGLGAVHAQPVMADHAADGAIFRHVAWQVVRQAGGDKGK
jgi:hypothetical protein